MPELRFVDYILDNIHGYIPLTAMESQIEKLPVFRRLRGIKQLGLTNWIFPGAEHTRYSHSLGVMHIADSMAERLGFTAAERQLVRLAGMLHDVGHYPLSHVGERAYKRLAQPAEDYSIAARARRLEQGDEDDPRFITHTFMQKNGNPFHHEAVGEAVIRNSGPIMDILERNGVNVDDVCPIITGDARNERLIKFVQLLHCELDADRIDYLLRDTFSSGTAYGTNEIDTLIKNLAMARHKDYGIDVIGVNAKGVMSADQFLINRYFAYKQVFYHKHVSILSYMGERIISYLLSDGDGLFPGGGELFRWIENQDANEDFFNFTDSFFVDALKKLDSNPAHVPPLIAAMTGKLRHYATPDILEPAGRNNVILSGMRNRQILDGMKEAGLLDAPCGEESRQGVLKIDESFLTEHVGEKYFIRVYEEKKDKFRFNKGLDEYLMHRLIHGVACINDGRVTLLHDAPASMTKDLCRHRTVFFRTYDME